MVLLALQSVTVDSLFKETILQALEACVPSHESPLSVDAPSNGGGFLQGVSCLWPGQLLRPSMTSGLDRQQCKLKAELPIQLHHDDERAGWAPMARLYPASETHCSWKTSISPSVTTLFRSARVTSFRSILRPRPITSMQLDSFN
jgi:hypothetical protein